MKGVSKASKEPVPIDPMQEMTLVALPVKMWPAILASFGMAAVCAALLAGVFGDKSTVERAVYWVGVVFFGGGGALMALQGIGIYKPVIRLSPRGFTATRATSEIVPWSAVLGVRTWSFAGSTLIVARITDEAWRSRGIALTPRLTRAANRWVGIDGLAISPMGMQMPTKDIVKLFRAYARAHRRRNPEVLDPGEDIAPDMRSRGEMI